MRARTAAALAAIPLLAGAGCSAAPAAGTFTPQGGGTAADTGTATAATGPAGFTMPPFGKNVHVEMTGWRPAGPNQARAVTVAKDFELAYLYAEYRGGLDDTWTQYVSSSMRTATEPALQSTQVTTQSFRGTIRYFDMSVIADPVVKGDLDVSTCFDNAGAVNTSLSTGQVIPDSSSPDSHYVLIGVELRPTAGAGWKVISSLPATYYPEASQCKP